MYNEVANDQDVGKLTGGLDKGGLDKGRLDKGGLDKGGLDKGGLDKGGLDKGGLDNVEYGTILCFLKCSLAKLI